MTGMDIRPGDVVWIRARVLRTSLVANGLSGDQQVQVHLFGKVDEYTPWVRLSDIERVIPQGSGIPGEPPDGEWLSTSDKAWRRDDARAAEVFPPALRGPAPRYERRWWDFLYQEWVDWPTAYERGARPDSSPFRRVEVEDY